MADIIPAGDRGTFTITRSQLMDTGAVSMGAFEALILAEAERRGLEISVSDDFAAGGLTVRWRPDRD